MRWLADECVDAALVRRLRGAGYDVIYAAEVASGATDAQILRRANDEDRLLLTEDKDFGEFVFRWHMTVPGLVLLRVAPERYLFKGRVWTLPCRGLARGCLGATLSLRKLVSGHGRCRGRHGSARVVLLVACAKCMDERGYDTF
jgi:Domain of unknown function (DUF5615)